MQAPNIALVQTEAASSLVLGTRRESQMKAWLGDPSDPSLEHDTEVSHAILGAHSALRSGAETITALTSDATRSDPERHAVGGEVSARTVAKLEEVQRKLTAKANAYEAAGIETINSAFALKSDDKFMHEQWMGFIHREAANTDGGYGNISAALAKHRGLANVIVSMPAELLNVASAQLDRWKIAAITKWEPRAQENLQMAEDLREVAGRYTRIVGMVRLNFHSPAIAAKTATRVRLT